MAGILAMKPELMIRDAPTSGLDPKGASHILKLLYELNKEGMTIVISTHDVDLVPVYSSQIHLISDGEIIAEGKPNEVFSDVDTIRAADLRLPRMAHLAEILEKEDNIDFGKSESFNIVPSGATSTNGSSIALPFLANPFWFTGSPTPM